MAAEKALEKAIEKTRLDITERQFVELLGRQAGRYARRTGKSGLRQGIGDDCAVLAGAGRKDWLVTTDLFLEGVHFRRKWQEPESAGHKALARGLSDIAAMGGVARYAFLSLGLPRRIERDWVEAFLRGFFRLAERCKVALAGGDTGASASGVVVDVIVAGEVSRNRAVLRSGARPGDEIWVTGRLGLAACGLLACRLAALRSREKRGRSKQGLQAFFYPEPRLEIGRYLGERKLASAIIDLSDGLSIDLARLCEASKVGARVEEDAVPRTPETPLRYALHGGEDFELLFTVRPEKARLLPGTLGGVKLTRIGRITERGGLRLVREGKSYPLPVRGFEHF